MVSRTENHLSSYSASLSAPETELLAELERARSSRISLDEIAERFGRPRAYEMVRSLVGKGALLRVSRGVYLARPFRALGRPWTSSAAVVATHILTGEPHYLGGWWAWSLHHLTPQVHASRIDAFAPRWRSPRRIANARIVFHRVALPKLSYGIQTVLIENVAVQVSDLERTLLDALDHPMLLGEVAASVERVASVLAKADAKRLVSYAARGSRTSTCQRLALLLERQGAPPTLLGPLKRRIRETATVLSLMPGRSRRGGVHPAWRVVEND